tara:strand:+ start:191 stop:640 length:450 start_codon:yes stop_codon:yes gene_type:complete
MRINFIKGVHYRGFMKSYEELLKKAQDELPELAKGGDRFSVEKIKGHLEGNKTILVNLKKIAADLGRKDQHLLKYLLRELAAPGKVVRGRVVLGTKVSATKINKKIKKYISEFVFCADCGKPDTELIEEKGISHLKCLACGSKKPVKNI